MTTIIVTKSSGRLGLTCENHPKRKGALVVGLVEASTAAAAGLRVGDLIVSVNHYPVSTSKECIKHIDQSADVLQLRLACATRKVVLNKAHGCVGIETCRQPTCGVGVEVAMVVDGSPAADAGVCVGDTVLSVNGTLVRSHAQAIELVDAEDIVELVLPNDTRMVEIVKPGICCELGVTVFNNPHGSGVVVGKLVPGGLAAQALSMGDIVLAIDDNLAPDHRTAVELMDGTPNVLRLLVRERTMSEAELEGAIKRLRVAARTASVGVCDVQLALDVCAADGTAASTREQTWSFLQGGESRALEARAMWKPMR